MKCSLATARSLYMIKKIGILLICLMILTSCTNTKVDKPTVKKWSTTLNRNVGIHDPAIFVDTQNGEKTYYVFGTHITQAKSQVLGDWQVPKRNNGYVNMDDNVIFGNTTENLAPIFEWAGHNDADSNNGFNLWAPDVIYNEDFEWKDGSKGAYLYYFSASSTWRRSAIGLMASTDPEGPYTFVDTLVYSGFSQEDATDGSERNIHYENTHLPQLIKEGKVDSFNPKWTRKMGKEYNTDYAPNALDPALIEDSDGKLWMVYGSWSGGIFLLEIDKSTGLPIYPKTDSVTEDGRLIDRYFGIKLAGGYHRSSEGPYITYHQKSKQYYLYLTYGGLASDGGYNMRVFKSDSITGPFVDAKGSRPIFTQSDVNDNYGVKIMGNYQLEGMSKGYKSAGHNSVLIDDEKMYLVFHTRFQNQGESFEMKLHEMTLNQKQWPVVYPYEHKYNLVIDKPIEATEVEGQYEIINHQNKTTAQMGVNETLYLHSDKTVSGALVGSYEIIEGFINIQTVDTTYYGIYDAQRINNTEEKVIISFIGDNNQAIYGSKAR